METETQETPVEVPTETPTESVPVPVETTETDPIETPIEGVAGELPKNFDPFAQFVPENPQLYSTSYTTDDYIITLVHDITLGDILIATLLSVLIIVQVLKALLGGGRRW